MDQPDIRTLPPPDLKVPRVFARLEDLVYNLWWSWSTEAQSLFAHLAPATWAHYRNPVDVLIDLGPARWRALQDDDVFTGTYHGVIEQFDSYMRSSEPSWFRREYGDYDGGPFAYFSTEFAWHECLQVYSGGLGVLSGDHCKSASDLGLPFVGVGLIYKRGYFRQTIDAEGTQQHYYPDYDLHRLPLLPVIDAGGNELHVPVQFPDREIELRVWKAQVGRGAVLLLDSDLPINHPADRPITSTLYVPDRESRLCQEFVLGVGGTQVLKTLGIEPAAWHLNEGHSALLALQRISDRTSAGRSLDEAVRDVSADTLFTTHTPVPAGHEIYDDDLVRKYFASWTGSGAIDEDRLLELGRANEHEGSFNLTALALRTSARTNGVSELHAKVSNSMWSGLLGHLERPPIEPLTNGVHMATWIGPEIADLLRRHGGAGLGSGTLDADFAERFQEAPDYELWMAHLAQKRRLVRLVRDLLLSQRARHGRSPDQLRQIGTMLDPEVLTIGFARRFATYKRADLLLRDVERLSALVADEQRPVQLLFAGKAHPADRPGQKLIRRICQASGEPGLADRVIFLENYDMRVGRRLVQGVDVWLNTPRRPHEASGTSGMKAAMNGVLNCSILDGWWCEGYDEKLGWSFGTTEAADEGAQDHADAESLYGVLADQVIPLYYERNEQGLPAEWIQRMKRSITVLTPRFSTSRMVQDYVERFYLPAARGEFAP